MTDPVETVDVIQADIEAAESACADAPLINPFLPVNRDWLIQAFAKHRTAHTSPVMDELLAALEDMKRAFCNPMMRRALGGYNVPQQIAALAATDAIAKARAQIERLAASGGGK